MKINSKCSFGLKVALGCLKAKEGKDNMPEHLQPKVLVAEKLKNLEGERKCNDYNRSLWTFFSNSNAYLTNNQIFTLRLFS